jgi:hypothetical protein
MLNDRNMIVMVLEHYDESLLALRRVMQWPMAEVLDFQSFMCVLS